MAEAVAEEFKRTGSATSWKTATRPQTIGYALLGSLVVPGGLGR